MTLWIEVAKYLQKNMKWGHSDVFGINKEFLDKRCNIVPTMHVLLDE